MRVEFLRAWEDNTWDTEMITVPDTFLCCDTQRLVEWANTNLATQAQYRKVVMFAVCTIHNGEAR